MPTPEPDIIGVRSVHGADIAILAGSGLLPFEIAEALERDGRRPHIVAIEGSADDRLARWPTTWVGIAQVGGMLGAMARAGCSEMVIAGGTRRPDLASLRVDLGTLRHLPDILALMRGGDDSLLRRVVRFFEARGLRVLGVPDVAPRLIAGEGALGAVRPDARHAEWISAARRLLAALSPFDVGQAAVVGGAGVIALEGADGTDAMLARLGSRPEVLGCVLVKLPKRGQEMRVDLPAIGPDTVRRAEALGLAGIAIGAGGTIVLGRTEVLQLADAAGMFIAGVSAEPSMREATRLADDRPMIAVSRRWPGPSQRQDARIGAEVVAILVAHGAGRNAVVARQHVLAVGDGAGLSDLLDRGRRIRPWGLRLLARRGGVVAMRPAADQPLLVADIERIAAAQLAGVVVDGPLAAEAAAAADRMGLFAVRFAPPGEPPVAAPATMTSLDRG